MPISAEARGKRRVLRKQLAASADRLLETAHSDRACVLTKAWLNKRGLGRMRAQAHLVALFGPAARLRIIEDKYLGWLYFRPRGRIVEGCDASDPGIAQDCVAAYVLLAGLLPGRMTAGISSCIWTLEISDHAIGRLFQRSPKVDPIEAMVAAHDRLMRIGLHDTFAREIWLPAGKSGAFVCEPNVYKVIDQPGNATMHVRARSWFDSDLLTDQPLAPEVPPPERTSATLMQPSLTIPPEVSAMLMSGLASIGRG